MVFQRKSGGAKAKQQTPAKPKGKKTVQSKDLGDEDMSFDETDSDDSGSEGMVEKKTPGGKTPKGKQGDKRVSFQVPGKNTPANKTPKNENSVGKKQPTPGKAAALKEFQGMLPSSAKKNGGTKRPAEDDDDEDEDEDDDDDSDEDADLDMLLDGASDDDDDDDDDDEDEDDDEEEDEDDEDDEDEEQPKKSQNSKQSSSKSIVTKEASVVQKSPSKNLEKVPAKKEQSSKNSEKQNTKGKTSEKEAQSPLNEKKSTPGIKKALEIDAQQKKERDNKTLFLGNLPTDITPTELKALSSDILEVHLPHAFGRKKRKTIFAFLEFANEAKAEENYKILKNKKLRGQPMKIDFRRGNQSAEASNKPAGVNLKKLFIPTLPLDVTIDQVASLFKKAFQITMNNGVATKHATVNFQNEKDAAEALEACKSAKIGNTTITVMFSIVTDKNKKKRKQKPKAKVPAAKKMKLDVKQESDDDDDDDDDDDVDDD